MRDATTRAASIALVLLLCCVGCVFAQGPTYGSIIGQLQVVRGSFPSRPVLVSLRSRGVDAGRLYSDNEGRFGFNRLPGNIYHVIIDDPDYAPIDIRVDLDPSASAVKMVTITLVSKTEVNAPQPDTGDRVPGKNPNIVAPNQPGPKIPDSAVREFHAGVTAEKKSKTDEAIKHYNKAVEIAPNFYQARNNMGALYAAHAHFAEAEHEFQAAIQLSTAEASAYFNLANVQLLAKKPTDAAETARKGLRLEPNSAFGQLVLGSSLERVGDPKGAEKALRRALELDPQATKAHLELVNLYLQQHDDMQAVAELKEFLRVADPKDPLVTKAREVLGRLEPASK